MTVQAPGSFHVVSHCDLWPCSKTVPMMRIPTLTRSVAPWHLYACFALVVACEAPPPEPAPPVVTDTTSTSQAAPASVRPVHWSYSGEAGPGAWGALTPVYALCANGKGQSPIDLASGKGMAGAQWSFDYGSTRLKIAHHEHVDELIDNGHTIQLHVEEGSTLTLNGDVYHLKQFHFHTPSEHKLDGVNMPMEIHFVHQDSSGGLAVVGVLVEEGAANANIQKLVENLPATKGDTVAIADHHIDLNLHLPAREQGFHYVGSLTTPPCSENVQWLVLHDHMKASKEQIAAFATRIGPNNRPVQPLNARSVEQVQLAGSTR